jgi:hypothetical protein
MFAFFISATFLIILFSFGSLSSLGVFCFSDRQSYAAVTRDQKNFVKFFLFSGAGGGNRTDGPD